MKRGAARGDASSGAAKAAEDQEFILPDRTPGSTESPAVPIAIVVPVVIVVATAVAATARPGDRLGRERR